MKRSYTYEYTVTFTVDGEDKDECDDTAAAFSCNLASESDGMRFGVQEAHKGWDDKIQSEETEYDCTRNELVA